MKQGDISLSQGLAHLIEANEPYWGGEVEVIRSYWDSPIRSRETDGKWLVHQMYKEYWDGIMPSLQQFTGYLPHASSRDGYSRLTGAAEVLSEETQHFALFANLYLVLEDVEFALSPDELKVAGSWPENDELMNLRNSHRAESAHLGTRAYRFTEGGYCALFTGGMKLAGRGGFDEAVADVCRRIYADEFNHMLLGIIGADDATLSQSDWETLAEYTVAQMKMRILMRNAQFSHPVAEGRMAELLAGQAAPAEFDLDHATQLMSEQARRS
jgi:hypothetical protein